MAQFTMVSLLPYKAWSPIALSTYAYMILWTIEFTNQIGQNAYPHTWHAFMNIPQAIVGTQNALCSTSAMCKVAN